MYKYALLTGLLFCLTVHGLASATQHALQQGRSSISGFVFDENRQPLSNIFVELLDDTDTPIRRMRTDGSGRYFFGGLNNGTFKVRARPFGLDYKEETQDATLENFIQGTSGNSRVFSGQSRQVDFYLHRLRTDEGSGGAIFVGDKDAPAEARKLYESGVAHLNKGETESGLADLKHALESYPNYFAALERLGLECLKLNQWEAATILLTKATGVNSRSFNSYFGLGQAQFNLKLYAEADSSLRKAISLFKESAPAHLWLGKTYRQTGKPELAEAELHKARKLASDWPEVHWQLALVYNDLKNYQAAINELEKILKLDPDNPNTAGIKATINKLKEKLAG